MKARTIASLWLLALAPIMLWASPAIAQTPSAVEIARLLIEESRAGYSGPCPCPYDTYGRGYLCGDRSAYSKPGGAEPLCYERDVTPDMIDEYLRNNR